VAPANHSKSEKTFIDKNTKVKSGLSKTSLDVLIEFILSDIFLPL
jgi:hypothetical protein